MTTGHVFIAQSLDGFIARADGDIDWLTKRPIDGEDHGYESFMAGVDGVIMGRATFQKVLTFGEWPYRKPMVVLSSTLTQDAVPPKLRGQVRVSPLAPRELMKALHAEGWTKAYVDGGKTIQSFLRDGLIQELVVTTIPVLLGGGLPLFGALDRDIDLELVGTRAFASGLVQTHYRV